MTEDAVLTRLREQLHEVCRRRVPVETAALVEGLARPAIRLHHSEGPSRSHLGGAALLDDPRQWPFWNDRPLSLVAVLDLAEIAPHESDPVLAPTGVLNFFYDDEQQPWGFLPSDHGGWRVIPADATGARPAHPPAGAQVFNEIGLRAEQTLTIPGWEETAVESVYPPYKDRSERAEAARLAYTSLDEEWSRLIVDESAPNHQIGGWPRLQQGPIWRECEVVSGGLPLGTHEDWQRAQATFDAERDAAWRLLLQLDTDDDAGWMWGDCGTLYFAVRQPTAEHAAVENAWLVLQCG